MSGRIRQFYESDLTVTASAGMAGLKGLGDAAGPVVVRIVDNPSSGLEVVRLASATTAEEVDGVLGLLWIGVDGSSTPADTDNVYVKHFGIMEGVPWAGAPDPVAGDTLYVTDAGRLHVVPGTNVRRVGEVLYSDGGGSRTMTVLFNGLSNPDGLTDSAPADAAYLTMGAYASLPASKDVSGTTATTDMGATVAFQRRQDASPAAMLDVLDLAHRTATVAGGVGIGVRQNFWTNNGTADTLVKAAMIDAILSDVTPGSEKGLLQFYVKTSGSATPQLALKFTDLLDAVCYGGLSVLGTGTFQTILVHKDGQLAEVTLDDGVNTALSAAGSGTFRYNDTAKKLQASENGGDYSDLIAGTTITNGSGQTVDAVTGNIITRTVAINGAETVMVDVAGTKSDYSKAFGYSLRATFKRAAGAASQVGATVVVVQHEDDAAADCNIVLSGNDAIVQVTGVAGDTINWSATMRVLRV